MSFTIYPALDLRGGKVVRLQEGDPARMTAYSHDPSEMARRWLDAGARWLHVINLDGAFGESEDANRSALEAILKLGARVQFGGGLRSLDAIRQAFDLGVSRVVLGTIAIEHPDVVADSITLFGADRIAVGIDARDGIPPTERSKMKDVILIDAGTGNLRSVQKALESVGAIVERTDDPKWVLSGKKIVLPGVGAFGDFMFGLRAGGLDDAINNVAGRSVPLLGICVGMQALFEVGHEMGEHAGLGLLAGRVTRFAPSLSVKIPHTGWNQVEVQNDALLFDGIESGAYVYFNHSYACHPMNSSDVIATTEHGIKYACAVRRENIFGVQFHPEKSQAVGLRILKNFLEAT